VIAAAHHGIAEPSVMAAPKQVAVTVFGHPSGAQEMAFMDVPSALGIITGVNAEQNGNRLAPVRALGIGVEQANVELQMFDVVVGQRRASGRFVKKIRRGHDGSPDTSTATAIRFRVDFIEVLNCRKLYE